MATEKSYINPICAELTWSLPTIGDQPVGSCIETKIIPLLRNHIVRFRILVVSKKKLEIFVQNLGAMETIIRIQKIVPLGSLRNKNIKQFSPKKNILSANKDVKFGQIKMSGGCKEVQITIFFTYRWTFEHGELLDSIASNNMNTLVQNLKEELTKPDLADWTLVCQDERIPCHTTILGARSDVFKAQFLNKGFLETEVRETQIRDMTLLTLKALLWFMYTDKLQTDNVNVNELMKAADTYMIPLLKDKCLQYLSANITTENAIECFILSDMYNDIDLKQKVAKFIGKNMTQLETTEEWAKLKDNHGLEKVLAAIFN